MDDRWKQLEALYQAARDPVHRSRILAAADPELRREVEALLADDDHHASEATATMVGVGTQLGRYVIEAPLGKGGMGEVFRARDMRLGRNVAIKVSNVQFSERFEREARAISSLNHPHICTLHDVGSSYLVMELVEGETLASRLKKGALSIEQTLQYGAQIADALTAAHSKGITHRDLKPGNIMLSKSAGVKVLDFGLAKIQGEALTQSNVVMGTPAYMAPEQMEGQEADSRTDIYSLGLVLYEMATGVRASQGPPVAEPIPERLAHVIERCMKPDPADRWQSARDVKAELEWSAKNIRLPSNSTAVPPNHSRWILGVAVALGAVLGGLVQRYFGLQVTAPPVLRLQVNPPQGGRFAFGGTTGGMAISPDGKTAAYVATVSGKNGLWLRPMDSNDATLLPGTNDAAFPFWSPDSKSVAYFISGNRLERTDLASGTPIKICDVAVARGGAWTSDGSIVFGTVSSGLFQVPASGGTPSPLTSLNKERGEVYHNWPQILPNNRILYWTQSEKPERTGVYVASMTKPSEPIHLLSTDANAIYAAVGGKHYLLWLRNTTLLAQQFDIESVRLVGEPRIVADPVGSMPSQSYMNASASANGMLLFSPTSNLRRLTWFDRQGKPLGSIGEPGEFDFFRLAPDDRHLVAERNRSGGSDLWVLDTDRGIGNRLTNSPGVHVWPVWSPNGRMILFSRSARNMFLKEATGTGEEQRLLASPNVQNALDWSRDGRTLLFYEISPVTQRDLWTMQMTSEGTPAPDSKPRPYLKTPFNEWYSRLSPEDNPRSIAFETDESGRYEVYIDAFPEPRGKVRISPNGGRYPQWSRDGRELYYVSSDDKLMAVSLKREGTAVEPSTSKELFQLPPNAANGVGPYEAAADGRFLVRVATEQASTPLTLIVNWPGLLAKESP